MDNDGALERKGILYVVATPIGNLEDITYRAVKILADVDALACEDTRQTRKIFARYEISLPPLILSYHEHNETGAGRKILKLLEQGKRVALCSDAGTPGVSDPGYRVISQALENDFEVDVIPGSSAVVSALVVSGLPTSSFTFKGFPPRKSGQLRKFLAMEKDAPHTLACYESPHRVTALLEAALEVLGNRRAAVCVELTKLYQRVYRGYLEDLARDLGREKIKGEITVVIAGSNPKFLAPNGE